MNKDLYIKVEEALNADLAYGVEGLVDYQKFHPYSIMTHFTAIEDPTVTEFENQFFSIRVLRQRVVLD